MKSLLIDFRMNSMSGIGTYIKSILNEIIDDFNIYLILSEDDFLGISHDVRSKVTPIFFHSKIYSIGEQLEFLFKIPRCDLFWSPHFNVPILPIRANKRIVTIHDLCHLRSTKGTLFLHKIVATYLLKRAVKLSDLVLTDSIFSKKEIEDEFSISAEVVYCGVDHIMKDLSLNYNQLEKDPFFLCVGNVKPHKNIDFLLRFFRDHSDMKLVIVGKRDGFINGMSIKEGIPDNIAFTGYIDDKHLLKLYKTTEALIFPSLYEGFGLPPVEAQRLGCPVVSSNYASMPEVLGDGAVYFDPVSFESLAQAIQAIKNKDVRKRVIEVGYINSEKYKWKKAADEIELMIGGLS